nr:reverse transcriptase domain-containing protein [Tanacetum cinerariifolium]
MLLGCYKGYHQIQMAEGDEYKTAFFAGEWVFYYRKMPFGLKNARATYQRLVDKVFHDRIGRNLKAYVDDMVIKSTSEEEMLPYIKENFEKFRSINMKLNLKKCSFGVEEGPFLGHLITKQRIRANPSKVKAITNVEQPKTLKALQSLNGKIAALNRFLSKGAERSLPFFKVLKSCTDKKNIKWAQEAEAALQEMKKFVEILPTLTASVQGEILMMYLAASTESISAALFIRRKEEHVLIYFVSRVLQGAELNYLGMEKLILALVHAARRLRRNQNKKADALRKLASMTFEHVTKEVLVEVLSKRSIEEKEILQFKTTEEESWMNPIHEYLDDIVKEVHEGSCGFNAEPRSMVVRITKQGYYWLSIHRDAAKVLQDYEKCKEQSAIRKVAESSAITSESGWPFSHWGVNILGPPTTAPEEHMEIMNHIEKKLARTQQGWVDDLAQVLWVHRTLPRNSQKETPFSLTYGSEAIIPIPKNDVAKDDRGRIKEVDNTRGNKEITSIEEAYCNAPLRKEDVMS